MKPSKKQMEVLRCIKQDNPKILICSGAKRAGKTFILIFAFLGHIQKYRNMGLSFIIGGASQATIRRNVLDDMEKILGKELKLSKDNAVNVFGNKVYCFGGANADSWKLARGFTSAGAFLNEGTALHDSFVKEVISRCSYKGARIYIDTNPENPAHSIKKDYIDNDGQGLENGRLNIKAFNFTLFDNDALDKEYVESIIKATPSGMFTDRDIYGRWVTAEGIVYKDFNADKHYISRGHINEMNFTVYFAAVDWGYEHFGNISVFGVTADDIVVMVSEHAKQYKEIDYWVKIAGDIKNRYGDILFYCDSARPEHVKRFQREGIRARNADKEVISGIEQVASRFKTNRLFICDDCVRFKDEIAMYAWNERTGEPIKQFDDVLDTIRYGIYTHFNIKHSIKIPNRRSIGL